MKSLSLSTSKALLLFLKPQTPKSKPPLIHHHCTNLTPNPNPPQPQSDDDVSLVIQNVGSTSSESETLLSSQPLELTMREPISEKKLSELYKMVKERNVELDLNTAALLIRSLGKAGMAEEGLAVFNEFDSELKSTHIRNVLIKMLLNLGRVDDALKVLDEMLDPEAKFRIDEITADVVIESLLKKEKSFGEEEIVKLVSKFGEYGVFPNSLIIEKLVNVLCRNGKVGRAWDVLCDVMKKGGGVEAASCDVVLTALRRSNDFERMREVMLKMEEMGIKPNFIPFCSDVKRLCKSGRIDAALEVFEKMREGLKGVSAKPDVVIYNTWIDGLCKAGRPQEGLSLMEKMRLQDGCAANTVTYNCLISGFNRVGDI